MSPEKFQLLLNNSQPDTQFSFDWSSYYPDHFANTYLPKVPKYHGKAFQFYDGAELLVSCEKITREIMQLNKSKYLFTPVFFTYPKGAAIGNEKSKLLNYPFTVCLLAEVNIDDTVEMSVKFGGEFREFLREQSKEGKLKSTVSSIENSTYKTTISKFVSHYNNNLTHFSMLSLVGNLIGLNFEEIHKKSALKVTIDEIKVRETKPKQNITTKQEKDIIIEFTITNQNVSTYKLQVFDGKKLIFENPPDAFLNQKNQKEFEPGKYKLIWDCSSNNIFNEKDPKRKLKFKVTATAKDKQSAFDTKEVALKEFIEKNKKNYNDTEFDANRVVVWLKEDYTPEKELLPNSNSNPEMVFAGAKLIRLKPNKESTNTPCLFWWNNAYHIQEFPEAILGDTNEIFNDNIGIVFQNDVAHTAHRATFITKSNEQLDKLKKSLSEKVDTKYESGQLKSALESFKYQFRVDLDNKAETIFRLVSHVTKVYEPLDSNGESIFKQILFVPLSHEWFLKKGDDKVKKRYQDYWIKNDGFNALQYPSGGGEVFRDNTEPSYDAFFDELLKLNQLSDEDIDTQRKNTIEWQWLISLTDENRKTYKTAIVFSLDAWGLEINKDTKEVAAISGIPSFASGIGIEQTFGIFRLPTLLTVLLHETSQTTFNPTSPIPVDSHTRDTKGVWENLSKSYSEFVDDEDKLISSIYISDYQIAAVEIMSLLNSIGL